MTEICLNRFFVNDVSLEPEFIVRLRMEQTGHAHVHTMLCTPCMHRFFYMLHIVVPLTIFTVSIVTSLCSACMQVDAFV